MHLTVDASIACVKIIKQNSNCWNISSFFSKQQTEMDSNKKRNLFVDALVMTFGVSAWIGITATFLQLPQIVQTAPEGWNLPSYIVILTQSGNIVLLIYVIYDKWCAVKVDDSYLIYITLGIGCLAAILMAFLYQRTIFIDGEYRSIPLFIFTGMFAIVGCLSSVLFMPFMGRFRSIYLVTYMFGQGLNGLLSSVLSLIQGVGSTECNNSTDYNVPNSSLTKEPVHVEPLFQPRIYFLFVFLILGLSTLAFILLNTMEICKKELSATDAFQTSSNGAANGLDVNLNGYQSIPTNAVYLSSVNFVYLVLLVGAIAFLNYGLLPGLQSFSCLSYGATAYHLATSLSSIANPVACLINLYISKPSVRQITALSVLTAILSTYILLTAAQSPTPLLYSTKYGSYLIVRSMKHFFRTSNHFSV